MAVASGVLSDVGFELESTAGVLNGTPALTKLRRVRTSLGLKKETYRSNEIRTDRSIYDERHGVQTVEGTIEGELAVQSYDTFIEALLGGTWTTGASKSNTEFTSLACVAATKIWTVGGGSLITEGIKIGDRITIAGCTQAGNYTVIDIPSSTTFKTAEAPAADMTADTSFTLVVTGKKVLLGTTERSFTIERAYTDISQYEAFLGCRINSLDLEVDPSGILKSNFGVIGMSSNGMQGSTVDAAAGYTAAPTHSVLAAVNGAIFENGISMGTVTNLKLTVNNGIGGKAVIGSNTKPYLKWGNAAEITGEMTVLFQDATMYNKFKNETESSIIVRIDDPNATDFLELTLPRVKYNGADIGDADPQGLPVVMPFRALIPATTTTAKDTSPIVIQRSNAS